MNKEAKKLKYNAYIIPVSPKDKLVIKMWSDKGKIIKFSVTYLKKLRQKWFIIKRCDNSHFYEKEGCVAPHCHIMAYKNRQLYKQPLSGSPAELLTHTINDFKKRRNILVDNYFNNNYERKND